MRAKTSFYPLSVPTWGAEERAVAISLLEQGQTTMNAQVKAFEAEFAAYHGMRYGIMVNSGSSANLVATAALFFKQARPLTRGDEVIVPAISWATTYHPLQQYGLKLRFVDVDRTLNADLHLLEKSITPQTRAIVAASILGNPAYLLQMRRLATKYGLYLIEDNCESLDAEIAGRKTGTFGDLNTFSFFFSHHISTMEGGMILTNDEELADICRALRAHGWTRDLPADSPIYKKGTGDRYEAYRFILPGYNVRPLEIAGAVGRIQLKKLPQFTALRRRNWRLFQALFSNKQGFYIQSENGKSSAFGFTIVLDPVHYGFDDRDRLFAKLTDADIEYRVVTGGNFLKHPVIKHYDFSIVDGSTPEADIVHSLGFFVGNHPFNLEKQLYKLHDVLCSN